MHIQDSAMLYPTPQLHYPIFLPTRGHYATLDLFVLSLSHRIANNSTENNGHHCTTRVVVLCVCL